jgi:shikimate kinase
MDETGNIFLVGPMGSGKTEVGKQHARALGLLFIDSDAEIEQRTGVDIGRIFDAEGEAGFRAREREVIADLVTRPGIVLSTGGGAILLPENREALRRHGTVVYLQTSAAQQAQRVRRSANRPLLAGAEDPAERLAALMSQRAPLYEGVSHLTVSTDGSKAGGVVARILGQLPDRRILPRR